MPKFFIHVRDPEVLYEDPEGVTVGVLDELRPHIEEVVAELIESEGPFVIDHARVVEVTDESGQVILSAPMTTSFFSKH